MSIGKNIQIAKLNMAQNVITVVQTTLDNLGIKEVTIQGAYINAINAILASIELK